jgi:hypothetical protein
VLKLGGQSLFNYHKSMEEVLRAVYPEFPWESSKFLYGGPDKTPLGHWNDKQNIVNALEQAAEKLDIKQVSTIFVCLFSYMQNNSLRIGIRLI